MGMSENGVYPQWNSHLVGVMISKTIGFFGVHNIFRQTHIDQKLPDLWYTLWWTNILLWKMAIEIVSFPIKHGEFPLLWDPYIYIL